MRGILRASIWTAVLLAGTLHAQQVGITRATPAEAGTLTKETASMFSGPTLGYVYQPQDNAFASIMGVPGTARTRDLLAAASDLRTAEVSPRQNYALGLTSGTGEAALVTFGSDLPQETTLDIVPAGADRVIISPSGSASGFYYRADGEIHLVAGLPHAPEFAGQVSLAGLPGILAGMAVSDDGQTALVCLDHGEGGQSVYALTAAADAQFLVSVGGVGGLSFAHHSTDALIADRVRNEVLVVEDASGAALTEVVADSSDGIAGPVGIGSSRDGNEVFVANAGGTIVTIDRSSGATTTVECDCRPSGLYPLNGDSVFLLASLNEAAPKLFDGGEGAPRVLIVANALPQESDTQVSRRATRGRVR